MIYLLIGLLVLALILIAVFAPDALADIAESLFD
jgi:hypothetical protein